MTQPVLVAGARTPVGKLLGSLSALPAPELAGRAIAAALERAEITGRGSSPRRPVKRPSRPGHASRLGVSMDGTQRARSSAS